MTCKIVWHVNIIHMICKVVWHVNIIHEKIYVLYEVTPFFTLWYFKGNVHEPWVIYSQW